MGAMCFVMYAAVLIPDRAPSLMSYMATICKFSKMYRHPSWVLYDQQFHQEAAESSLRDWSKVDGGIHSCCFNGQRLDASPWCSTCRSVEHSSVTCPVRSEAPSTLGKKRQLQGAWQAQESNRLDLPVY